MDNFTPSLEKQVLDFLAQPDSPPLTQRDLARRLGLPRSVLRSALRNLEAEGKITRLRKNRWSVPRGIPWVTGQLRVHPDGYGFVTPDGRGLPDIFIPPEGLGPALDGDRVVIATRDLMTEGTGPGGRARETRAGRVVRIIQRRRERLVGLLRRTAYYWYVIPDNPRIRENVRVRGFADSVGQPGEFHKVVVELQPRERPREHLSGTVVEDLGPAGSPGVDTLCLMRGFGLVSPFPAEAQAQAAQAATVPSPDLFRDRADFRDRIVFTIDPEDARDFDDAVSLSRLDGNRWLLGVHIADVAHYVAAGSPVDLEARRRGNSVYLVDRVLPMLPPYLTTEVCSLQPGRPRLTHSVLLTLDSAGTVLEVRTTPSVIESVARLSYDQVQLSFDRGDDAGISPEVRAVLEEMRVLARILRNRRMAAGSLDLVIPEVRCLLDDQGRPRAIMPRTSNEAYQLIEEFMLAANQAVAQWIAARGVPSLYRVHEAPDEEQWEQMRAELRSLGLATPAPSPQTLPEIARRARALPVAYAAHLAILRNLKRARYASTVGQHFGLAFPCYTHFTSPIRRYPDLVVHRVLRALENGANPPYAPDLLRRLAQHCSETEYNAAEAEAESLELKRLDYYQAQLAAGETGPLEGLVVGVTARGLNIELKDTLQRGFLPFTALPDDHYQVDASRLRVVGRRRRQTWTVGQALTVQLARIDRSRRTLSLIPFTESTPRKKRRRAHR